jgi:hypothetical protein
MLVKAILRETRVVRSAKDLIEERSSRSGDDGITQSGRSAHHRPVEERSPMTDAALIGPALDELVAIEQQESKRCNAISAEVVRSSQRLRHGGRGDEGRNDQSPADLAWGNRPSRVGIENREHDTPIVRGDPGAAAVRVGRHHGGARPHSRDRGRQTGGSRDTLVAIAGDPED